MQLSPRASLWTSPPHWWRRSCRAPLVALLVSGAAFAKAPSGTPSAAPASTSAVPAPANQTAATPSPPAATPAISDATRQEMRTLVREAGQFMDQGNRLGAVERLERARRLVPDPSIDYNLAQVYGDLHRDPEAAAALARFLSAVKPETLTRDRLDEARARLQGYQQRLARLTLEVTPPNADATAAAPTGAAPPATAAAQVSLDGRPLGAPIINPLWLLPGDHRVSVSAPAAQDYAVTVQLSPGEQRTLTAALLPAATGPGPGLIPSLARSSSAPTRPVYTRWWFWTATVGGAAAVALIGAAAGGAFNRRPPGLDLDPIEVAR